MNTNNNKHVQAQVREDQFLQSEPNQIHLPRKQLNGTPGRKRPSRRLYVLIGILVFLFVAGSISSAAGYFTYHTYKTRYQTDLSLAQEGIQQLQKAESLLTSWPQKSFDTQIGRQAETEFASSFKNFDLLNRDLKALPGIVKQVPVYGARLDSALRLVPLAMTLSQAGTTGCNILNTLVAGLHDPLTSQAHGITQSDLVTISQDVKELQSVFVMANHQINQLQPDDIHFDVRLPKLIATFHKDVPVIQEWITSIQQLLPVVPTLLGISRPTNYLIEVLDSTELRPGGGLIGNYGIATLSGGRLSAAHITDADLLDRPFEAAGHTILYPDAYKWFDAEPGSWSLHNSNLDANFPTSAQNGEQAYTKEGGNVPVQGVIALTPALIQHALTITGPIAIPEYQETVTAQNLIARIHFHQLGGRAAGEGSDLIPSPDGHSSLRKRFTELLAEHFLTRVRQLPATDLSKLLLLMGNSIRSKDLQMYFNSRAAETLLDRLHLDATIQSTIGDSLFVVDANIAQNKANSFIVNTLNDQATIDSQGNVIHHATLQYSWTIPGKNYGSSLYRDYVHVYVPPGSTLLTQDGWQPRGTSNAFNREVWLGYFELTYGQTRTITLVWKVPAAVNKVQSDWHYQYLLQRQAGALWKVNLHVLLPSCAAINSKWGGMVATNKQQIALTQPLTEDMNVGADYACA